MVSVNFGYYIYRGFQEAGDCRGEQKWGNISRALRGEIQIELTLRGNMVYTEGVLYPELDNFFCWWVFAKQIFSKQRIL